MSDINIQPLLVSNAKSISFEYNSKLEQIPISLINENRNDRQNTPTLSPSYHKFSIHNIDEDQYQNEKYPNENISLDQNTSLNCKIY